jgi:type VI secretion system protein
MSITLFEKLDDDTVAQENFPEDTKLLNSIQKNITALLNTRQNSLIHLADYGLPDLGEIYRGLPNSLEGFLKELVKTIEKYEPRLYQIKAVKKATSLNDCVFHIDIIGKVQTKKELLLEGYFTNSGLVYIK